MLLSVLLLIIGSNAFTFDKNKSILYSRTILLGLICTMLLVYEGFDFYFFKQSISLYNGLLFCNLYSHCFNFFIIMLTCIILCLTCFFPNESKSFFIKHNISNVNKNELTKAIEAKTSYLKIIEYPLLMLFVITGSIFLLSSNDLITIFLSIELQSYGLYILASLFRDSESSTSAGLTYFLLGGLSSCIILFGQSLLYVNFGTTSLDGIFIIQNIVSNLETSSYNEAWKISETYLSFSHFTQYSLQLAFVVFAVGFLFKISSAPFHSWSPSVYDALPTITTTFLAIIAKISILILLFQLVYYTGDSTISFSWKNILIYSSLFSLIIGSLAGLSQFKIKKLYAYSTISHIGFILLALSINSIESIQAFFFYIIQYSLSNLNAFIILIIIGYNYVIYKLDIAEKLEKLNYDYVKKFAEKSREKKDLNFLFEQLNKEKILLDKKQININNISPIEYIDQIKGYFLLNPFLAISLSISLYSFIGIPPLVGFFAKQMILSSALDNGFIFMSLIAILTSVISAVYYLYIIKHMFFEKSEYTKNNAFENIVYMAVNKAEGLKSENSIIKNIFISGTLTGIISLLTLLILLFIFIYKEIYNLINLLSIFLIYG